MKLTALCATLATAGLIAISSAYAADAPAATPVAAKAAAPAAAPAPAPAAAAAATGPKWTKEDVTKFCTNRWKNNANRAAKCEQRHQAKIGKPENAAVVEELKTGKRPPRKPKAAK